MCGIVGFVGRRDDELLAEMRDTLSHRGPDGKGSFADSLVSLGHRRLSIVDISRGAQPMMNEDESVVLVFNGEIYNHRQLRAELEEHWHDFRTDSDTESIVHAYEHWGVECVKKLDGMFSFVLYDRTNQILFGARDRMGQKPLYYTEKTFHGGGQSVPFAFASEVKALHVHPAIAASRQICGKGLLSYLVNDYVAGPRTIYEGIAQLPPGHAFVYGLEDSTHEGFRSWPYWEPSLETINRVPSVGEACETIDTLLSTSVERRLMSDVPLGVMLSGGIDSTAIVAIAARHRRVDSIKTFSIGFDVRSFDERKYAQQVADSFGTQHFSREFTAAEMQRHLPSVISHLDEPFADPSILPVSLLTEFASEYVTVVLGGDGGDELFAGYDPFRAINAATLYRRIVPRFIHQRMATLIPWVLPSSSENMSLEFKVSRFLRGARAVPEIRCSAWMGPFSTQQLARLLPDLGHLSFDEAYADVLAIQSAIGCDDWKCALNYFQKVYLPDDILYKVDRASMLHAVEVRSPFLDRKLVEYVNSLPTHMKFRRGVAKFILKKAMLRRKDGRSLIPPNIVNRRKKGFGIPVAKWIRGEMQHTFREVLMQNWPTELSMFDTAEIGRLLEAHVKCESNNYKELWALFVLAEWCNSRRRDPVRKTVEPFTVAAMRA